MRRIVVSNSSFITANKVSVILGWLLRYLLTVNEVLHALLTICEGVEEGPAHSHRFCTQT
jgi:hypothetical protein